jgi:hypothetical protein
MKVMDVAFVLPMVGLVQSVLDQCLLIISHKDVLVMQYHAVAQLLPVLQTSL